MVCLGNLRTLLTHKLFSNSCIIFFQDQKKNYYPFDLFNQYSFVICCLIDAVSDAEDKCPIRSSFILFWLIEKVRIEKYRRNQISIDYHFFISHNFQYISHMIPFGVEKICLFLNNVFRFIKFTQESIKFFEKKFPVSLITLCTCDKSYERNLSDTTKMSNREGNSCGVHSSSLA